MLLLAIMLFLTYSRRKRRTTLTGQPSAYRRLSLSTRGQLCRRTAICAAAAAYTSPLPVFQQMCETGASSLAHCVMLYCSSAMLTAKTPPLFVPSTKASLKGPRALAVIPLQLASGPHERTDRVSGQYTIAIHLFSLRDGVHMRHLSFLSYEDVQRLGSPSLRHAQAAQRLLRAAHIPHMQNTV